MCPTLANGPGGDRPRWEPFSARGQRCSTVPGESWINSPTEVFVARNGEPELTTILLTGTQVRDLVEQMLKVSGRRLDLSKPAI